MLAETDNFLELDYLAISKTLASSELNITSELEVFNAANEWLKHNITERRWLAKQILQKVRLPLLSHHALQYLLKQTSSFTAIDECVAIIKETLDNKAISMNNKCSAMFTNRYFNQKKFNILVCGGFNYHQKWNVKRVYQIGGNNLMTVKDLPLMIKERQWAKSVCLKGDVYVFGGDDNRQSPIASVEKYSHSTKSWSKVADMFDDRTFFCVCAFMGKIFIIGGCNVEGRTNSCLQFNTKSNNWNKVAGMNEERSGAACAVFEGNVVVAGGLDNESIKMRSVQSFDVIADEWLSMPDMINAKCGHSLVVVKNKLFVIGDVVDGCEVFDNSFKKFIDLKSPLIDHFFLEANAIGCKIIVFGSEKTCAVCYDVDKDEWSHEPCDVTKNISRFSCVKVPWF